MTNIPPDDALIIAPLWKFYDAAKVVLAELEALPSNAPNVDWPYIERSKAQMKAVISDFEQRFPGSQGIWQGPIPYR